MENTQLVPTITRNDGTTACNARDLHRILKVGRDFSTWFKGRIDEYGFREGVDFVRVKVMNTTKLDSPNLANQDSPSWGGDRRSVDYHLSVDMAKELAMLEANEIGMKVRRYFIQVEKEYQEQTQTLLQDTQKLLASTQRENAHLQLQVNARSDRVFTKYQVEKEKIKGAKTFVRGIKPLLKTFQKNLHEAFKCVSRFRDFKEYHVYSQFQSVVSEYDGIFQDLMDWEKRKIYIL